MMKFPSSFLKPCGKWEWCKSLGWQSIIILILCIISYKWLDRPIALFMLNLHPTTESGYYNLTDELTTLAYLMILIIMIFYAYLKIAKNANSRLVNAAGGLSLVVPIAFFIKTQLQFFFGRIPPRYADNSVLLFVRRPDLYGFHLMRGGSFPSGHMCVFTATLLVLCFYYPKAKSISILALCVLAFLLLFYNYHFLSDLIAGTYLGYVIARILNTLQQNPSR